MSEKLKDLLVIVGSTLGVALMFLVGVEINQRLSQETDLSKTRSIMMSAEGKVVAQPDTAQLSFGVVTNGKDSAKVQEDSDKQMKVIIDYLKQSGVSADDIKTSGYNLYPQYDYTKPNPVQEITGYSLNQNVDVKVRDLNKVGSILGGLTAKGVNQINNVSYFIDDPDALRAKARTEAVGKAKQKAQELASTLGIRLGKVINFSEGTSPIDPPIFYGERGAGGGGTSPVEPGSQDVTVTVTLTFEIK